MVSTGTVLQAGGCNQGKGAAEHPNSCTSVCLIAPLLMYSLNLLLVVQVTQPGRLAQRSGLAKIFLEAFFMLVGICRWRGQDPGCRNKAKCHSVHLRSHRAVWVFSKNLSSKRNVFRRNPSLHLFPISVENLTEALDEDQWWAVYTQIFYCIINALICLILEVPWCIPWCAGQLLWPCSSAAWTSSCQPLLNQCLVLFLRTALAWAKGISCSYANSGAFIFGLKIMQPFQIHLSPLMYSWRK